MTVIALEDVYTLGLDERDDNVKARSAFFKRNSTYRVLAIRIIDEAVCYLLPTEWGGEYLPYFASSRFFAIADERVPAEWHLRLAQTGNERHEILLGPACFVHNEMFYEDLLNGESSEVNLWEQYLDGLTNAADEVIASSSRYLKPFEETRNDHLFLSDVKLVKVGDDGVGLWFLINREITEQEVTLLNILEAEILWQFSNEARFGYRLIQV